MLAMGLRAALFASGATGMVLIGLPCGKALSPGAVSLACSATDARKAGSKLCCGKGHTVAAAQQGRSIEARKTSPAPTRCAHSSYSRACSNI